MLKELTPDSLTVLVVAKFLGIVRVEVCLLAFTQTQAWKAHSSCTQEKKLELRTAPGQFVNTKKNFRNLETIVTSTCLKKEEEERARQQHVSHLDNMMMKQAKPQIAQKPPQASKLATQPSGTIRHERSLSLDEGKHKTASISSDREDGPIAETPPERSGRPMTNGKAQATTSPPAVESAAVGGGMLAGAMRRVGLA